jgi:hypothetical protein
MAENTTKETRVKHYSRVVSVGLVFIIWFFINPVELSTSGQTAQPAYKNPSLTIEKRVDDLLSSMSLVD